MTNNIWEPHSVCIDHSKQLVSPVIPKSACTTLRHHVFFVDEQPDNWLKPRAMAQTDQAGQLEVGLSQLPDDYECLLLIREPLDRLISGMAEVIYRQFTGADNPESGQLSPKDALTSQGKPNLQNSDMFEEHIWKFINKGTNNLWGFFDCFTTHGVLNIHVEQQTTIMDWQNLQNKFQNITMIEVDKNLWPNITQWMNERGTPISDEPYVNANPAFSNGHKAYIKGIYTLAVKDNRNNLLDDYKKYFQTDIDFYNSQKADFYRGAEQ